MANLVFYLYACAFLYGYGLSASTYTILVPLGRYMDDCYDDSY